MDAKDIQSDLHGLKKLYALLRKDGAQPSTTLSDSLDAHARLLLKNLLDTATERVLKAHSEVVAGQPEASGVVSPARLQQPDEAASHSRLSFTGEDYQSCEKEIDSDHRLTPNWSQAGDVEQSIAIGLQHGQKSCRGCRQNTIKQVGSAGVAQDSNTFAHHEHQQNSVSDHHLWNRVKEIEWLSSNMSDESKSEKQRLGSSDLNVVGNADISSDRMAIGISNCNMETVSKPEESDCLSQEATKAIQQIELCMSTLHMGADHSHLFESTTSTQPPNHVPETKSQTTYSAVPSSGTSFGENFISRNNLMCETSGQRDMDHFVYPMHQLPSVTEDEKNQPYLYLSRSYKPVQPTKPMLNQSTNSIFQGRPVSRTDALSISEEDKCRFPAKKVNKIYVQNVNAIVENIEPVNWIVSSNRFVPSSVALVPSETSNITPCWPATSSSNMDDEHFHMAMDDEDSKPSFSFMNPKNHPPNVKPENLVNKKVSHLSVSSGFHGSQSNVQHKVGVRKKRHFTTAVRGSLENQDSDATASDANSSWSSQQTSSDRNSEDYSVTDGTGELHYVTSSKSSESWDSSLSHGSGSQYSHYKSYSEENYSSSSEEGAHYVTTSSSSENEGYSSYEQPTKHVPKQPTSKKSGPTRFQKAYGMDHNKQSGMLKRLKDKMAVIFHHHHHHHHHHHKRGDRTNGEANRSLDSSLDKHKGKAVNSKRQDDTHGTKVVEKKRDSQIREKKHHSNFHGLMGGLVRHVRHSKKSKPGKGTADQLAEEFGRKKNLKKTHWWQLVQNHERSKLPNKTHMKLGLGKKKTRLKALPKME